MSDHHYLRLEAMDLFERCLTEGSPDFLKAFIEEQITQEPPRIELLQGIAEDLHQRLLGLREYHFDVRDRVLRILRNDFKVDISSLAPPDALNHYHSLNLDQLMGYAHAQNPRLTVQEQHILRKVLEASLNMAAQLHADVLMTEELFNSILDWIDGLSAAGAKFAWLPDWQANPRPYIH